MADVIIWYLWMQVFALSGWLVASRWLRALPDRGYAVSKALGLLLGGFAYWWIVTLGLSANGAGAVLMALVAVFIAGAALWLLEGRRKASDGRGPFIPRPSPAVVVATELLFALAFIVWAIFRAYNPDITEAGGEKFMEIMMLNAILRSPSFPPNDAWLSGFSISYYYFGYVILAMLARISGVAPAVAFNLGNVSLFALTLTGAFGVGYNLSFAAPRSTLHAPRLFAGLATALMLGVMGNMGGFMEAARCSRVLPASVWVWLDVRQIRGEQVECNGLAPTRFYWWWDWSRVVHDYTPAGQDQEAITEMPVFSFILGDNHPHVMSLPFVLVAMALALNLYWTTDDRRRTTGDGSIDLTAGSLHAPRSTLHAPRSTLHAPRLALNALRLALHALRLALSAIVIGGLSFMNTWDFPVYGALVVGSLLLGRWLRREPLWPGIIFSAAAVALGYALYLPFYATFASQASGIGLNLFNGTRWVQFVLMFAPFLVAGVAFLWLTLRQAGRFTGLRAGAILARAAGLTAAGLAAIIVGAVAVAVMSSQVREAVVAVMNGGDFLGVTRDIVLQRLAQRLADPWVALGLLFAASLCAVLILMLRRFGLLQPPAGPEPYRLSPIPFVLLLFMGGALLAASVEFVFLRDMFGTRMNTIFKFYYQAWTVWAVASGFALVSLAATRGISAKLAAGAVGVLVLAGVLYPLFAVQTRTVGHSGPPTLDGGQYLSRTRPDDYQVIQWLNQNVVGAPTIAEAPGDRYAAYTYQGRISAFTGLPTLLGWGGHQNQWRGNYAEPGRREPMIEQLFATSDIVEARRILDEFDVRYVIVGKPERDRYPAEGLAKFDAFGAPVFRSGDTVVYQIAGN